jgi:hypothetical protein
MLARMSGFSCESGPKRAVASRALLAAAVSGLMCLGLAACGSSASPGGVVTSSKVVSDMTLQKFTQMCDDRSGTVEINPHCGGSNSCKGMSYDEGTQTLTEHTCKATNTCAGYSCILPS